MSPSEKRHAVLLGGPLDGQTRAIRGAEYHVVHADETRNLVGYGRYVRTGSRAYEWDEAYWLAECRSFPEWWEMQRGA